MNIEPKYDIGSPVYHVCDGTTKGFVVDWRYFRNGNYFEYQVTFSTHLPKFWVSENELLKEKKG